MRFNSFKSGVKMFCISFYCDKVQRDFGEGNMLCCRHEYTARVHIWNRVLVAVVGRELEPHRHEEIPLEMFR